MAEAGLELLLLGEGEEVAQVLHVQRLYMCTDIYICMCTYIHIHMYVYIHIDMGAGAPRAAPIYVCMYIYT